jgi:hypothetical protein
MDFDFDKLLNFKRQKGCVSTFDEAAMRAEIASCRQAFFTAGVTGTCLGQLANYAAASRKRLRRKSSTRPCPKERTRKTVLIAVKCWMKLKLPADCASPVEALSWLKSYRGFICHAHNWCKSNYDYRLGAREGFGEKVGVTRRNIARELHDFSAVVIEELNVEIAALEEIVEASTDAVSEAPPPQKRPMDENGNFLMF